MAGFYSPPVYNKRLNLAHVRIPEGNKINKALVEHIHEKFIPVNYADIMNEPMPKTQMTKLMKNYNMIPV